MAFDPRLLRYARTTRAYLVVSVLLGGLTALLVVAQAWLLADTVAGAFAHRETLAQLRLPVALLLAAIVGRAALGWCTERAAQRASARAKSELRTALVEHVAALGPARLETERTGGLTVLATRGIDALDGYFSRYLPQVFLAVIVPVTVIAVVGGLDWISAAIIAVTVPLVPLFMALVGASAGERMERQIHTLQRLAGHFLDAVAGLPTLKVFGRAKAQAAVIGEMTDRYRQATMLTLRSAFLSSLVLELLATISVALVAVAVGLRLLGGHLDLRTALFVLVLAPEAYLPLRTLGTNFHASAEGLKAAEQVFTLLERPLPTRGAVTAAPGARPGGHLSRPRPPRPPADLVQHRPRGGGGDRRPERLRQVDPARGAAGLGGARRRVRAGRRRRPGRARHRPLAGAPGVGAAACAPLRHVRRRERAAGPVRRAGG